MSENINNFPTKEIATYLAARAAFTEYICIKLNIEDICPEFFFESWIKLHIFHAGKEFEDAIFADCIKLLVQHKKGIKTNE